jgi:hypothetical protein
MNDVHLILLGFALGAAPARETGRLVVAAIGRALGVEPTDVVSFNRATDGNSDTKPNNE